MREHLQALAAAGINKARFSAKAASISQRGFLLLEGVRSPIGDNEYCWVDPATCRVLPPIGKITDFVAEIRPYTRDDGSSDFTLAIRHLEAP